MKQALLNGSRGLQKGGSISRLLAQHRGARNKKNLPGITVEQILDWTDQYHEKNGKWPNRNSGQIEDSEGETWMGIQSSLAVGGRGLPRKTSFAKLLHETGRKHNKFSKEIITEKEILKWADEYNRKNGKYPSDASGKIEGTHYTWSTIGESLRKGRSGLTSKGSLTSLLARNNRKQNIFNKPDLTDEIIIKWIIAYLIKHGKYPKAESVVIPDSGEEKWRNIDYALRNENRGLKGKKSLSVLIEEIKSDQGNSIL